MPVTSLVGVLILFDAPALRAGTVGHAPDQVLLKLKAEVTESEAEELVQRRKSLTLVIALIAIHTAAKLEKRNKVHELSENRPAGIHKPSPRCIWNGQRVPAISNRFWPFSLANSCQYLT